MHALRRLRGSLPLQMHHHDLSQGSARTGRPRRRTSLFALLAAVWACWLLLTAAVCACAEDFTLTQEEMDDLLYEAHAQDTGAGEYLVLPEGYEEPATGYDGVYHLLLLGVDSPTDKIAGRSDTMLLASLYAREKELRLTSFMRDLYVQIPGRGHNRLNAAFAFGGPELLLRTLRETFGVSVDGYVAVNYASMAELVDAIGGVDIDVAAHELKPLNGILDYYHYLRGMPQSQGLVAQAGYQTLNGEQTMSYARIRKIDSDFERVSRQQRVMEAVYRKLAAMDLRRLLDLVFDHLDDVRTNVSAADALRLVSQVQGMRISAIRTLRIPVDGAYASRMIRGAAFLVPKMSRNLAALRAFLAP